MSIRSLALLGAAAIILASGPVQAQDAVVINASNRTWGLGILRVLSEGAGQQVHDPEPTGSLINNNWFTGQPPTTTSFDLPALGQPLASFDFLPYQTLRAPLDPGIEYQIHVSRNGQPIGAVLRFVSGVGPNGQAEVQASIHWTVPVGQATRNQIEVLSDHSIAFNPAPVHLTVPTKLPKPDKKHKRGPSSRDKGTDVGAGPVPSSSSFE